MALSDIKKALLAAVCLLQFGLVNANAQDSETYSRVGLTLQGGYTLPGNAVYRSNFNAPTVASYNYGAGLKFALLPVWSVEAGYMENTIQGSESSGFETKMQSLSLKNMINFNRLYQKSELSRVINIYGLAGAGYDFYEFSSANEQHSGRALSFIGGLGVELSIGRAFDLFSQYEMKFSSNRIDNINSGSRFDQIGIASAGIRLNFGRDDARPLKHKPRSDRSFEADNRDFAQMAEEPQTPQNEEIPQDTVRAEQDDRQDSEEPTEVEEVRPFTTQPGEEEEEHQREQIDLLTDQLTQLQEEIDSLERRKEELRALPEPVPSSMISGRRDLSPGFYVQVFTGREPENAERVKNRFRALLSGRLDNPDAEVFVNQRGPFHEVLIGNFSRLSETEEMLETARGEFSDSFPLYIPQ